MPTIRVILPTPLRALAGGQANVRLAASTVSEALAELSTRHPNLRRHLYGDDGTLRRFVNIYLNDGDIRYLEDGTQAALRDGDEIRIVPSIAGGAETAKSSAPGMNEAELRRYARHIILPEVGTEGQERLRRSRVLIVGAGGLGSPASLYLAAAGVGTLGIVDFDVVEYSNLQRQIIHGTADVGRSKLDSARDSLHAINPEVTVERHESRLTSDNALQIIEPYDVVVDGTDNFPTRYLVNDACVLLGKPNVYGSIFRFEGQASVFFAARGPCYRCLFREPPPPGLVPSCAEAGVLGVLPGIIGAIQANEAIKLILEQGDPLIGRLLLFDALSMRFRELHLRKDRECPICGDEPTVRELIDYEEFCGVSASEALPGPSASVPTISARRLKARLDAGDPIRVIDVREPFELRICRLDVADAIPMRALPSRINELSRAEELVVVCRNGHRSADVVRFLRERGFARAYNLDGGLRAWSDDVDPCMPRY
ncbi:MAG: molybdopterin-synthase adenylyltransferase MoeB [Gemmatimonadales bacterium]|jgi:adenylyltransferase/sulfurtransferase